MGGILPRSGKPSPRTLLSDWDTGCSRDGIKQDVNGTLTVADGTNESKPPFKPDHRRPGLLAETSSHLAVLAPELFEFPPQGFPVDAVPGLF